MQVLAAFIRQHKQALVADWLTRVRALPAAGRLPTPLLADHVPLILDAISDALERGDATPAALEQLPLEHAAERYREGYDLRQIVAEYRILRRVVVEAYEREHETTLAPFTTLNELVDRAIGDAVDHYAAERDRARDFFVAILGHDLRNPLSAIDLSTAKLRTMSAGADAIDAGQVARYADRVSACVQRMQRMIADLLDFARGRLGGEFPITPVPSDIRSVITATVLELASVHPEREIRCHVDDVPGDFHGVWDTDRVAQAVSNLVSNAIQHGQDPIVIEPRDDGETITISVRSRGDIPPERRRYLFDPFRGGSSTGIGLGLYIVREIARAHGGKVDVEGDSAGNTTFCVTLPREPPRRFDR
jgi:signal transduction histidine kinase